MGNAIPIPPPGFEGLSIEEKIEYVQSLWDHIASDVETVPLADWQKQLLDERLKDLEENPKAGIPWSQVRAGILRKLGKRGA
ncbi:MAG: addiction module protein [Acidobacteriota bacterium]